MGGKKLSKYCIECGSELTKEAKFCSNCGTQQIKESESSEKKVASEKPTISTNSRNSNNEEILGIFPAWIELGGKLVRKTWTCKLVFTTNRLIVADEKRTGFSTFKLQKPYYIFQKAGARDKLKMKEISVEVILKANNENIEIPYSEIAAIETKNIFSIPNHIALIIYSIKDLDVPEYTFEIAILDKFNKDFKDFISIALPDKI